MPMPRPFVIALLTIAVFTAVSLALGASFLDAQKFAEFNRVDGMHLTAKGHRCLADKLAEVIPGLL